MIRNTFQPAVCLLLATLLVAQQTPALSQNEVIIPKGTRIELVSQDNISSATAVQNSVVRFALAKDLVVNEVTVLTAGTPVEGRVSRVRRGVPYRKWGELTISIKRIQIGNHSYARLRSSDPESTESMIDDFGMCALVLPLCIALAIGFKEASGKTPKPGSDGAQAVLAPCVGWTFWTGSDFKFTEHLRAESKTALHADAPAACIRIVSNQTIRGVQVR